MNSAEIVHFLRLIGAKNIQSDDARGWVRASCPLAPWLHESGQDRKPSFGVKVPDKEGESPYYHCFACQSNGQLPKLLSTVARLSGDRQLEASNYLSQFELFSSSDADAAPKRRRIRLKDRFASVNFVEREVLRNPPVPSDVLAQYPLLSEKSDLTAHATALRWLAYERHISLQSIAKFKLRLFVNPLDDIGVIFPIIDKDGETVLDLWARLIDDKSFFRVTRSISGAGVDYKAPNLLFGNHLFDQTKPGVLVEGAVDALRLHTLGIKNVVASFGALSSEQLESLYAPVLYLGFDNDDAGHSFTRKAMKSLRVPSIGILDWSVAGIKDAGELTGLDQFKRVFDERRKILRAPKVKTREVDGKPRARRVFLKDDGTFL